MEEKKWKDLSQYEYPEGANLLASKDFVNILKDRTIKRLSDQLGRITELLRILVRKNGGNRGGPN